ncbi:hypothetical protein KY290_028394 [Solanum tuberosum]|uniref:DUF4283 domain-containing protein n=1 Tax=Solanum tuberosum TaxID=4113 RepID=A0ABQ7UHS9_SOLTU|nr:hypothetical protein KY290_028394 [Solanum tuberosum]
MVYKSNLKYFHGQLASIRKKRHQELLFGYLFQTCRQSFLQNNPYCQLPRLLVIKSIAVDKATQDKSRPSMARVKVEFDLLANLPHRMRIQYVDEKTGKSVEQFQKFDLPFYCNYCKHQGHNESECQLLLGNNAGINQEEVSKVGSEIKKYHDDAWEILDEKRAGNKSLVVDKSGVHDQIDSKIVDDVHSSGNKVGATETLEKKLNDNQLSLTTNPTLAHIDDEGQNNAATIVASTIDDEHQLNGTRGDVGLFEKSGHPLVINATVELALDPKSAKVVADGGKHDAQGVESVEFG